MPISFTWPHSAQSSHVYVAIANEKDLKNSEAWVKHKLQYEIEAAKFCITLVQSIYQLNKFRKFHLEKTISTIL